MCEWRERKDTKEVNVLVFEVSRKHSFSFFPNPRLIPCLTLQTIHQLNVQGYQSLPVQLFTFLFLLFLEPLPNAILPIAILPNTIISKLPFYPMPPLIYFIVKITPSAYLNARELNIKLSRPNMG